MNTNARFRLHRCLWLAALLGLLQARPAAPRFETPVVADGAVTLRLVGESGRPYRVEVSSNLVTWAEVTTAPAVNGFLTVQHAGPAGQRWLFYRAVLALPVIPYPTVSPTPDTNLVAHALVTPAEGGTLYLQTMDGPALTLAISSNAVFTPTVVSMTLVTNLAGLPAAEGFLTAVRLEPEGLVLAAPAFLEVNFTTNLPASRIASFAFNNDGTRLHLVPDLVGTNRVRILVNQLRGHGSGMFTLEEVEALAATGPAPRSRRVSLHASMEECYPDEEEEARALHEELEEAIRPVQQKVAALLAVERQKQLLGVEEPGEPAVVEAFNEGATFYEQQLKPRVANAAQKCAVARELLTWLLGYERQRQLLGVASDDDPRDQTANDLICQGLKRCEEEALECCRIRGPDRRLVVFLLGLERTRQLLGMTDGNCAAPNSDEAWRDCVPEWTGELKIVERGRYAANISTPSIRSQADETWTYELSAYVNSVEVEIVPPVLFLPGFTNLTFELSGLGQGAHTFRDRTRTPWDACSGAARVALAGPSPHDGGESFERRSQISSVVSNVVNLTVTVSLDSSGSVFGPGTWLNYMTDMVEAPLRGLSIRTTKSPSGAGCEVETTTEYARGSDLYGFEFVRAGEGEFHHSPDQITHAKTTTNNVGNMQVTKQVTLNLKRVR